MCCIKTVVIVVKSTVSRTQRVAVVAESSAILHLSPFCMKALRRLSVLVKDLTRTATGETLQQLLTVHRELCVPATSSR